MPALYGGGGRGKSDMRQEIGKLCRLVDQMMWTNVLVTVVSCSAVTLVAVAITLD